MLANTLLKFVTSLLLARAALGAQHLLAKVGVSKGLLFKIAVGLIFWRFRGTRAAIGSSGVQRVLTNVTR